MGIIWVIVFIMFYHEVEDSSSEDDEVLLVKESNNGFNGMPPFKRNIRWQRFVTLWPLWAIYVAHFAMNWTNYIIMQWLPTYLVTNLGANKESISLTAVPYVINSLVGVGMYEIYSFSVLDSFESQPLVTGQTL